MTDEVTARTARGNPTPARATRAPRWPGRGRSGCEITLLVSKSCRYKIPLDKVAGSTLLDHLAMWTWVP
jgi:hypothetical protein